MFRILKYSPPRMVHRYITVRVVFCLWAVELIRVMRKMPQFGVGIVWGTIPSGLPVLWIIVPGWSRNSYGTSPNLWVQKTLVKFWQGTQDTWLCFAKFLREFLSYSPIDLFRTWEMYSWVDSGSSTFCALLPLLPSGVSLETAANFLLFLNVAILLRKNSCQWWRLNLFHLWLSTMVSSKFEGKSFQWIQTV